ncbi:MAG: hypothetical protein M5R41_07335 [Bacteroidia bacterium]|nr:hypothetical protein [Bacteroidia bacterium]
MTLSPTARRALDAYGGEERWRKATTVEAEISAAGLLFTLKRRPPLRHARIIMEVAKPVSRITPIGKSPLVSGVLYSHDVALEDAQGTPLARRTGARAYFPYKRRLLYWDDLDMAYFANYAFWNYLTFPRLLLNDDIVWTEKADGVLSAYFPEHIPTHSREQVLFFDNETGLLRQHNYNADVVTPLATAANTVIEHARFDGHDYPSLRRVTPRTRAGVARGFPLLVEITVHSFSLQTI